MECSGAKPSPVHVIITVTGVFYPAMATGRAVTHQGQCEGDSRMPRNPLPSLPPIHGSCTPLLQYSTHPSHLQDPTTFYIPRGSSQFLSFKNNPYLAESVASPRLSLGEGSSIWPYFFILSDIRLCVWVCVFPGYLFTHISPSQS